MRFLTPTSPKLKQSYLSIRLPISAKHITFSLNAG
jgi:hypothetical protein